MSIRIQKHVYKIRGLNCKNFEPSFSVFCVLVNYDSPTFCLICSMFNLNLCLHYTLVFKCREVKGFIIKCVYNECFHIFISTFINQLYIMINHHSRMSSKKSRKKERKKGEKYRCSVSIQLNMISMLRKNNEIMCIICLYFNYE